MRSIFIVAVAGLSLLTACSSEDLRKEQRDAPTEPLLDPPPAGEGVQYRMTAKVEPGTESYGCQLFTAPPEGLYVQREDVKFSVGGHHVLLYRTPYAAIPDVDERGEPIAPGSVHDCSEGATARFRLSGVLGGSESFSGDGMLKELPEGVAVAIEPGAVLLMSTHYLNATPDPIEVDARINLYTIPREQVAVEAGVLYLDNPVIRVPPLGKATARMQCPIKRDIYVVSLQSHMHRQGVAFSADVRGAGGIEEIYATDSWADPPVKELDPLLPIKAGSAIDFRCDYESREPKGVVHGVTADDEMCQLIGPYFPRDRDLEACKDEDGAHGATWVGDGRATCSETLKCMSGVDPFGPDQGFEYFGCVMDACPGAAKAVSDVVRCELSRGDGECMAACATPGGQCDECVLAVCSDVLTACDAASCTSIRG